MMMDLLISIVTYNTKDLLRNCLQSILDSRNTLDYQVCVVDNTSSDGTPAMVRKEFPQVRLIVNEENKGFGKGNNQVMKDSGARYILILNPDIVVSAEALEKMVKYMDENQEVEILGCKLLNPDRSVQTSCRRYPNIMVLLFRVLGLSRIFPDANILRRFMMLDWDHSKNIDVDWVIGSGMMIRNEALRQSGLFDEGYFMYYEDVDLCLRIWHAGKVRYFAEAEMVHHHRQQSHGFWHFRLRWIHLRSACRFFRKHGLFPKRPSRCEKHPQSTLNP